MGRITSDVVTASQRKVLGIAAQAFLYPSGCFLANITPFMKYRVFHWVDYIPHSSFVVTEDNLRVASSIVREAGWG